MENELLTFAELEQKTGQPRISLIQMADAGLFTVYEGLDEFYAYSEPVRRAIKKVEGDPALLDRAYRAG